MMRLRGMILIVAAAALAGCSPDKGKEDTGLSAQSSMQQKAAVTEAPPRGAMTIAGDAPQDGRPLIVCFGDSITAGYGVDPGQSYPDDLQQILDAKGYRYRVVNMGISGETTKDGVQRVQRLAAMKPAWVVLEFGGNDGLRGLPVEATQANLITMVKTLRAAGIKVLLAGISLPPQYGPDYVGRFTAVFPAVASQTHVPLLKFLYEGIVGVPGDIQEDGIHPTAKGAKQVAANVAGSLLPLLSR